MAEVEKQEKEINRLQKTLQAAADFVSKNDKWAESVRQNWGAAAPTEEFLSSNQKKLPDVCE